MDAKQTPLTVEPVSFTFCELPEFAGTIVIVAFATFEIDSIRVNAGRSLALCTDQLAVHRFQLAIVLAIAEVFAVYGTEFIFSPLGALKAVGVGWLLLTMIDVRE